MKRSPKYSANTLKRMRVNAQAWKTIELPKKGMKPLATEKSTGNRRDLCARAGEEGGRQARAVLRLKNMKQD